MSTSEPDDFDSPEDLICANTPMPPNTKKCCDACRKYTGIGYDYGEGYRCTNYDCPCHTPNTKKCCEICAPYCLKNGVKCKCLCHHDTKPTPEKEKCGHEGNYSACLCGTYDALLEGVTPTPAVEDWEKKMDRIVYERHEQLHERLYVPFLAKPIAIPDTCPKCGVNLKAFYADCKNIFRSLRKSDRKRIVEETQKMLEECEATECYCSPDSDDKCKPCRAYLKVINFITNLK